MPLQVTIITPERTVLKADDAEHVLLPGVDGQLGILPGHTPMVASLCVGQIRIDRAQQSAHLATSGGFAEVRSDRILVLAETAEKADEIDVERAARALQRARQELREAEAAQEVAFRAAIARALNRLHTAGAETGS